MKALILRLIKRIHSDYKSLITYISSGLLGIPINIIVAVFNYRHIDPQYMGIWNAFILLDVYGNLFRLGIINGMNRALPLYFGQKNFDDAINSYDTAYSYTIVTNFFVLLLFSFIYFFWLVEVNTINLFLYVVVSIRFYLNSIISIYAGSYRTSNDFNKISKIQVFTSFFNLLTIFLVLFYHFIGFVIGQLSLVFLNFLLYRKFLIFRPKIKFNFTRFKELFRFGFPIFVGSYLLQLSDSFPRLFLVKHGSMHDLGLYSFIYTLFNFYTILSNFILSYSYPKLTYSYGKDPNQHFIFFKITLIVLFLFLFGLIIGLVLYFLKGFILTYIPKYSAVEPLFIFFPLLFSLSTFKIFHTYNNIVNKRLLSVIFPFIYCIVSCIFFFLLSELLNFRYSYQLINLVLIFVIFSGVAMYIVVLIIYFSEFKNFINLFVYNVKKFINTF